MGMEFKHRISRMRDELFQKFHFRRQENCRVTRNGSASIFKCLNFNSESLAPKSIPCELSSKIPEGKIRFCTFKNRYEIDFWSLNLSQQSQKDVKVQRAVCSLVITNWGKLGYSKTSSSTWETSQNLHKGKNAKLQKEKMQKEISEISRKILRNTRKNT